MIAEETTEEADSDTAPSHSTVSDFKNLHTFKNTGFCFFYNSEEKNPVFVFKATQTLENLSDDFRFTLAKTFGDTGGPSRAFRWSSQEEWRQQIYNSNSRLPLYERVQRCIAELQR